MKLFNTVNSNHSIIKPNDFSLREIRKVKDQTEISKAANKLLDSIHKNTRSSIGVLRSVVSFPVSQMYEELLTRIDELTLLLLSNKAITENEKQAITSCQEGLESVQKQFNEACKDSQIDPNFIKKATEDINFTKKFLDQLSTLTQTSTDYQKIHENHCRVVQNFYTNIEAAPLKALNDLNPFLKSLAELNSIVEDKLEAKDQPEICRIKLEDMHQTELNLVESELERLLCDTEIALNRQLKHLRFLLNHQDELEKQKAQEQIAALKNHIKKFLQNSFIASNLPRFIPSFLYRLHSILNTAHGDFAKLGRTTPTKLVFGSQEYDLMEASRPALPKGILSHVVSYLNPLEYIPEKWRPSNKCMGLFLATLLVAATKDHHATILETLNENISSAKEWSKIKFSFPVETNITDFTASTAIPIIESNGILNIVSNSDNSAHDIFEGRIEIERINEIVPSIDLISQTPDIHSSTPEIAIWRQEIARRRAEAQKSTKNQIKENASPKTNTQAEINLIKENKQLIIDTVNYPAKIPSDNVLTSLIGLFRPDLKNATIAGNELEGLVIHEPLSFIMDTMQAYLDSLNEHPEFSSNCREESCRAIFENPQLSAMLSSDKNAINIVIEKMRFALNLSNSSPLKQAEMILRRFEKMQPQENFFFPIRWEGNPNGHAMILEIEKNADNLLTMRIFNLGSGAEYHGNKFNKENFSQRILPFFEFVNIDLQRIGGGAFTSFLDKMNSPIKEGLSEWNSNIFYEIALASLGGEISSRKDSSELLRDPQYIGNCGMASSFAILDKNFVGNALAERMRALTMFRASKAYFKDNPEKFSQGSERESRRKLLGFACLATYEAVERAVETGGLSSEESQVLLQETREIENSISKEQREDLGEANQLLSFENYKPLSISIPAKSHPELYHINAQKLLFKGGNTPRDFNSWMQKAAIPRKLRPPETLPLQDQTLLRLLNFAKNVGVANGPVQSEVESPLDHDDLFYIGVQPAREIISAANTETLKITETINLFYREPKSFMNDDKLSILMNLLQDTGILQKNLENDPGLIHAIHNFCSRGRKIGHLNQDVEMESFFTYLMSLAQANINKLPKDLIANYDLSKLPSIENIFTTLIEDSEMDEDKLKIIHYYRLKSLDLLSSLTVMETGDLLSSINYLKTKGFQTNIAKSSEQIHKIWDLVERSQIHFSKTHDANAILNEIARGVEPEHIDCEWVWHSLGNCYADKGQTMNYDPNLGILERQLLGRLGIPKVLANDSLFQAITNGQVDRLDRIKPEVFVYNSPKGISYRFVINGNTPIVQREFNLQWFQAADPKTIENFPIAFEKENLWHENGILWLSVDQKSSMYFTGPMEQPILKLDKASFGSWYQAELLDREFKDTGLKLTNFKDTDSSFAKIIARVENKNFVFAYSNQNELGSVFLPRLNLQFNEAKVKDKKILKCTKLDGYGLTAGNQALPLLGDFSSYLLLKKFGKHEKTGLLIPFLPIVEQDTGGLRTPTAFIETSKTWKTEVPYFFFKVENDFLVPQVENLYEAVQANLLITSIFLSEQRYEEAVKYLKKADTLLKSLENRINKDVIDQLLNLATFSKINKDNSLNAAAIHLQAASMAYRLANLDRLNLKEIKSFQEYITPLHSSFVTDYEYYGRHIGRINSKIKLSKEQATILSKGLSQERIPNTPAYAFPIPFDNKKVEHQAIHIKDAGPNIPLKKDTLTLYPESFLTNQTIHAGAIITSFDTLFVNAFPEGLLDLYEFLEKPEEVGKKQTRKIARQFGLDELIAPEDLKSSMRTLLELRYRFISSQLNSDKNPFSIESKEKLNSEQNLIAALIRTANAKDEYFTELEKNVQMHSERLATLKTMPIYKNEVNKYPSFENGLSEDTLKIALTLWEKWVTPVANPIPLTIKNSKKIIDSFVGPVQIEPLLQPFKISENNDKFAHHNFVPYKPATFFYSNSTIENGIESLFSKNKVIEILPSSPYMISESLAFKNPALANIFKQKNDQFINYIHQEANVKLHYSLKDKTALANQAKNLKNSIITLDSKIQEFEQLLVDKLNKSSPDPLLQTHKELKRARKAIRGLTVADAKAALARGWDFDHLNKLNPDLSIQEIEEIFHLTLSLMLEKRESQRQTRFVNGINDLLKEDSSTDAWQKNANKLMKILSYKNLYDPYEYPTLLLGETELNYDLWPQQIPTINRLAPKQQISAMVQLAQGEGKTDIITSPVLCMLADGKTLPILVLTEPLVSTVVPRLQERISQGYNMEVRLIPIDRGEWTKEKILALKNELETMIEQRIPLVWSPTDIQTLINSYIESLKEFNNPPTAAQIEIKKAWQNLFHLTKTSGVIVGDEIQAIYDILTSHDFSLGDFQSVSIDEMDAIVDFIRVVLQQPDISNDGTFPFKTKDGSSLTEEYFNTVLRPKIIETLLERGIIDNPRCKELFELMTKIEIDQFRNYLSKPGNNIEKRTLFPLIDKKVIEALSKGESFDKHLLENTLKSLLPSDQEKLEILISNPGMLGRELQQISSEYDKLNQKIYNHLAVQKESLRIIFSATATSQFGKHYVLDKMKISAIPADNGTPLWDAQFGNTIERGFLTSFLFHQIKIPREIVIKDLEKYIQRYQELFENTFQNISFEDDIDLEILNDDLIKEFENRYGSSCRLRIRHFSAREIDKLHEYINARFDRQLPFIRDYILPEQKVYPTQIETTTHMFGSITKAESGIRGTTGTLNVDSFPLELQKNVFFSDTEPKVIFRIKSSSADKVLSLSMDNKTPREILDQIYGTSSFGPGNIIDTTGKIQKEELESYARNMLELVNEKNPLIKKMAYYDGDILKVISLGIEQPSLYDVKTPQEEVAGLWDIAHTTGSNILVNPDSHAFVIIGKDLRFFELLQAVMRMRVLGSGQKLEFVISKQDISIIIHKLDLYLGVKIAKGQMPTVDQIIQYAVLNEALEERDINWRAIEMRMRMAILNPIMDLLWNVSTPPQDAIEIFNLAQSLFIKERSEQPWDQYGASVGKLKTQDGVKNLLQSWMNHPMLNAIEQNPSLFKKINLADIKKQLTVISKANHGLLPSEVDSENTGLKQRTRVKEQTKVKAKEKVRTKEKEKLKAKEIKKTKKQPPINEPVRTVVELRRKPFTAHPSIPPAKKIFFLDAHSTVSLENALSLTYQQLIERSSKGLGTAISAIDFANIDPSINKVLKITDPNLKFSLNLVPVWKNERVSPPYTPYSYFHKAASHILIIENKKNKEIQVNCIDGNEAEAYSKLLKQNRDNPNEPSEVNIGVYNLIENRMIASGATPISNSLKTDARLKELIVQAKLLSGITQYPKEEEQYLENWIKTRDPLKVLETFIFRISLNRFAQQNKETRKVFINSKLGKTFQNLGISNTTIEEMLNNPRLENNQKMHRLLFDRSLTKENWIKLAQEIKNSTNNDFYTEWSDIIVPTLPVMYNITGHDGAGTTRPHELDNFNLDFVQRRWLMNTFFRTLGDELGAWKTAVPQLSGVLPPLSFLENLSEKWWRYWGKSDKGHGADLTYLDSAFNPYDGKVIKSKASVEQLETMSDLSHPIWGLPSLSSTFNSISKRFAGNNFKEGQWPLIKEASEVPSNYDAHSQDIRYIAFNSVDLLNSLKDLEAYPDYQYESLFGIYHYLAISGIDPDAQRYAAIPLAIRLHANKFGNDSLFYAQFIPKLTVSPEHYSKEEIENLLTSCFEKVKNIKEWQNEDDHHFKPSTEQLSLSLSAFAVNAPKEVAEKTSKWLDQLLNSKKPDTCSWLDMLLFQMLQRNEALIDHQGYKIYFAKSPAYHMRRSLQYGKIQTLTSNEVEILNQWKLKDFDLFAHLAGIKTKNAPELTIYNLADKWANVFENVKPFEVEKEFWNKILGEIADKVKATPPTLKSEKASLRRLVQSLDNYSRLSENTFEILQSRIGNIRLAADYSFNLEEKQAFGFEEIKKLPSHSDPHVHKIYEYFIPNFMLTKEEVQYVPSEKLPRLLDDLHFSSSKHPAYSLDRWENVFTKILAPFTSEGTSYQQEQFFKWTNSFAQKAKSSEFGDAAFLKVIGSHPSKIEHSNAVAYVGNREKKIIHLLYKKHVSSYPVEMKKYVKYDFHLFSELFNLATANRQQLAYDDFANRMISSLKIAGEPIEELLSESYFDSISNFVKSGLQTAAKMTGLFEDTFQPSAIKGILETIYDRAIKIDDKSRKKEVLSELIKAVEIHAENNYFALIPVTNNLRLISDYSSKNPIENIQKATVDLFRDKKINLHSSALQILIPDLLSTSKNTDWIKPTLEAIATNPISSGSLIDPQKTILNLFANRNGEDFLRTIDTLFPTIKIRSLAIDELLRIKSPDLTLINHGRLKSYIKIHVADKLQYFMDLGYEAEFVKLTTDNFDVLAQLNDHVKLSTIPPINVQEVVTLVNGYLANNPSSQLRMEMIAKILKKLTEIPAISPPQHSALSNMIQQIDQWMPEINEKTIKVSHINNFLFEVNKLRFKIDFNGSNEEENITKALKELLNRNTSKNRQQIYLSLINSEWLPKTRSSPDLFKQMLQQINDSKSAVHLEQVIDIVVEIMDKNNMHKTAAEWLSQPEIIKKGIIPSLTSKTFISLTKDFYLDYSIVEQLWIKADAKTKQKLITDLSLNPAFYNLNFCMLNKLAKLSTKNSPEATLIEFTKGLKDYFVKDPSGNGAKTLLSMWQNEMPWGYLWNSALSADEKNEVQNLLNLIYQNRHIKNENDRIIQQIQDHANL
jgi:hypothetical protein